MTQLMLRSPAIMSSRAFDQFFESFFTRPEPWVRHTTSGYPITDIFKNDDGAQVIQMALAGFSRDRLKIETDQNRITVSSDNGGETECEDLKSKLGKGLTRASRIARRSFSKTFVDHQNQLDMTNVTAEFVDGLLTITIPLITKPEKRIVQIT